MKAGALGVGLLLALWAVAAVALGQPHLLPGPLAVAETVFSARADLAEAAVRSLGRVGAGWLGAAVLAVPLGWSMGAVPALDRELARFVSLMRPIPPFAWLPLLLLWVGIGDTSARLVCGVGAFFPILAHAREGVSEAPAALVMAGRNLGASGLSLFWRVQVPAALPTTATGLRAGWTLAWMSLVAAELVGADGGLGQLVLDARNLARPDLALAGMIVLGALAAATSAALERVGRRWT